MCWAPNRIFMQVEAVFNEFVQLDETSMFEDYEQVTDGTLEGWALADPGALRANKHCVRLMAHSMARTPWLGEPVHATPSSAAASAVPREDWSLKWISCFRFVVRRSVPG